MKQKIFIKFSTNQASEFPPQMNDQLLSACYPTGQGGKGAGLGCAPLRSESELGAVEAF